MYSTLGNYWPARSLIHALDPRTKVVGTLLLMVGVLCAQSLPEIIAAVMVCVLLFTLARIPFVIGAKAVAPLSFIVVLTMLMNILFIHEGAPLISLGWFEITSGGVAAAVYLGVRLTILLSLGCLLTLSTTIIDITYALERLMLPLVRFGFPAHELSLVIGIALRFVPQLLDEWKTIRQAQRSRGATLRQRRVSFGALTSVMVPLIAGAFRHADTLANGMDARCYRPGAQQSHLYPHVMRVTDVVSLVMCLIFCASMLTLHIVGI